MDRFAPILPEIILSIGGTILMMVAAFAGRRGAGLVGLRARDGGEAQASPMRTWTSRMRISTRRRTSSGAGSEHERATMALTVRCRS